MGKRITLEQWWENQPDPQRPPFPYHEGLTLSIRRHTPPKPYGSGYQRDMDPKMASCDDIIQLTHSEWCLQHPVRDTPPHSDTVRILHITGEIACRDGHGAQIVCCYLDDEKDRIFAAKIYDPLYYPSMCRQTAMPNDVTRYADFDYNREATAYEELKTNGVDGELTPQYYGSWTFNIGDSQRPVRMILMEYIEGVSLYSLLKSKEVLRISPEMRLEIFAQVLEVDCKVLYYFVSHRDFAPRNIMIVGLDLEAQTFEKVLLIDFNKSVVWTQPHAEPFTHWDDNLPLSPLYEYWIGCPEEFRYWVPQPHRSRIEVFRGWLKTRWEKQEGWAGPTEYQKEEENFDEPVEIVPPEQEDKQLEFLEFLDCRLRCY